MIEMTCIVCPVGCRLRVEKTAEEVKVSGQGCRRGELYAKDEVVAPKRVVTAVVGVKGWERVLAVKTAAPIPKEKIFIAMNEIKALIVKTPIKSGVVIKENLAETGVALIATQNAE